MFMKLFGRLQLATVALGATLGRWYGNDLINVLGFGPLPRRMTDRGSALFALGRRAVRLWSQGLAPLELAAVQSLELRLELLVFQLHLLALPRCSLRS